MSDLKRAAILALCVAASACAPAESGDAAAVESADRPVLAYEPTVVELSGVIDTIHRYGPPGFGENPAVDQEMVVSVVKLDAPVDLAADSGNPVNQAEANIGMVQLVAPNDALWATLQGKRARVSGSLFHATAGTHFTNVLVLVQGIAPDTAR